MANSAVTTINQTIITLVLFLSFIKLEDVNCRRAKDPTAKRIIRTN